MNLSGNKGAILKKITAVLLGIAFSILALELGLRLAGFLFTSFQEYSNRISLSKKGAYRILCLGESTTAGQYPPFLEEILNQRSTGIKFSVIDRGVISTNTAAILFNLKENLDKYKPDMVVTMMGCNDTYRPAMYYKDIPDANTKLFRYSRVYRLIRLIYNHVLDKIKIAMEFKPENSEACYELARLYQKSGRLIEAEKAFKRAIELDPKNTWIFNELGQLWRREGRLFEAEEMLKKAIELNPKNDSAYFGLGRVCATQNRHPEAEAAYKKAIELNPENDSAFTGLGLIYIMHGRLSEAEGLLKEAMKLNPVKRGPYINLASLYYNHGRLSEAEGVLKGFLSKNPGDDLVYKFLENLYRQMQKVELAEEYRKKREELGLNEYCPMAVNSYHKLKEILDQRGIRLVCVQYPMRSIVPLKKIFEGEKGVVFVDNENIFKEPLKQDSYAEYFKDAFAGDFGHCTQKGNRLLAKNIADVILKEIFGK